MVPSELKLKSACILEMDEYKTSLLNPDDPTGHDVTEFDFDYCYWSVPENQSQTVRSVKKGAISILTLR